MAGSRPGGYLALVLVLSVDRQTEKERERERERINQGQVHPGLFKARVAISFRSKHGWLHEVLIWIRDCLHKPEGRRSPSVKPRASQYAHEEPPLLAGDRFPLSWYSGRTAKRLSGQLMPPQNLGPGLRPRERFGSGWV